MPDEPAPEVSFLGILCSTCQDWCNEEVVMMVMHSFPFWGGKLGVFLGNAGGVTQRMFGSRGKIWIADLVMVSMD
jgi:hypothetical protein